MTKTTITVDPETHSNVLKMQSILTLMSGTKCSLSDTVNYSVNSVLNATSFNMGQMTMTGSQSTTGSQWTTTSNARYSLREEK